MSIRTRSHLYFLVIELTAGSALGWLFQWRSGMWIWDIAPENFNVMLKSAFSSGKKYPYQLP